MKTYKIVRMVQKGDNYKIAGGLTLRQAQAHCRDPETSSSTCKKPVNVHRTKRIGAWFDGYEEE